MGTVKTCPAEPSLSPLHILASKRFAVFFSLDGKDGAAHHRGWNQDQEPWTSGQSCKRDSLFLLEQCCLCGVLFLFPGNIQRAAEGQFPLEGRRAMFWAKWKWSLKPFLPSGLASGLVLCWEQLGRMGLAGSPLLWLHRWPLAPLLRGNSQTFPKLLAQKSCSTGELGGFQHQDSASLTFLG